MNKHTPLKNLTAGLCLGAAALACTDAHGQASTDALIDQLLKKGVLTESEAATLRATAPAKPATASPFDIKASWKDGLYFETADKKTFKGRLTGRVDLDVAGFDESDEVEAVTGPK